MRATEFKEIDGEKYACTMMPATKAQKTLVKLVEIVGRPALMMASSAFTSKGDVRVEDFINIGVATLFDRLSPEDADHIVKDVLDGVRVDGKGDIVQEYDNHFRGRIMHLYRVFAWALEVNYRDFFDAARSSGALERLVAVGTKVWTQPTTTQPSTDSSLPTKEPI